MRHCCNVRGVSIGFLWLWNGRLIELAEEEINIQEQVNCTALQALQLVARGYFSRSLQGL
jgi:hypothetical protein